jgi:PAS domain S-box-containing protein
MEPPQPPPQQALCHAMLEDMRAGAVTLDRAGVIVYCNASFAELMGTTRAGILGRSIFPSVPEDSRSFFLALQEPPAGLRRGEIALRTAGGGLVPVLATMSPIRVHGRELFCLIVADLTGQRREAQLLADCRRKDEFLAMLAHELRNPIAPIRNAARILALVEAGEPRVAWARQVIDRQVTHMTRLIDDLLDVSRITRGKVRLDSAATDLRLAIRQAIETARPLIEARGHRLTVDVPDRRLPVRADLTRLSQALSNLLDNAAKFTPDGGRIGIAADQQGPSLWISVRDTGIGISPEMLPRVFDLFAQADATPGRLRGGLGLGLTLARTLVEMHGGTVEARSTGLGCGSELVVRLPALADAAAGADGPARAQEPLPLPPAADAPRRILIVDDNLDSAESLMMVLCDWGHDVRTANDAESALELARLFLPHVMFVDIGLPRMNGYDLARALRVTPGLEQVLLVAVTGYGREEDRRASMEAGFNDHWVKPINLDALSTFAPEPRAAS